LPAGSPISALLNKKFQLSMALPYQVTNRTDSLKLSKYDILTGRIIYGAPSYIEFQAYDALNLHSVNPIAQSSISFSWTAHTYYYKSYTY
jgi:hypothetical protein